MCVYEGVCVCVYECVCLCVRVKLTTIALVSIRSYLLVDMLLCTPVTQSAECEHVGGFVSSIKT